MLRQILDLPNYKSYHKGLLLSPHRVNSSSHSRTMSEKTDPKPDQGPSPIGEISHEPSSFEAFLDANQKKLIIVGILAILCVVGYVIFDGVKTMTARNAAGDVAAARTVPDYDSVSNEHEGQNAGGSALILKSQLLWRDQQQQEAIKSVEEFIENYPEHPALGSAYASLGSYQQQLGNTDKAKTAYEKSVETESSASSLALLSLGDIALKSGESGKAKELYDQILTKYEKSHFQVKNMAEQRLKLIGVNAPTEKAPEPPAPVITPGAATPPVAIPGLPGALTPGTPTPTPTPTPAPAPAPDNETKSSEFPELELPEKNTPPKTPEAPSKPEAPTTPEPPKAPAGPAGE